MLRIEHLSKTYGEKKAVDDLSLHIRPGEIYGFIGHNGAGKTTTIKCCAGILQFEQGEIYIDGKSVKADPLGCKQQLAYIPDNPDLYEFLSGVKYLNFVADIFGVSKTDREARIEKYADLFDLTGDRSRIRVYEADADTAAQSSVDGIDAKGKDVTALYDITVEGTKVTAAAKAGNFDIEGLEILDPAA